MMVQGTCEPLSTRGSTLSSCCVGTCQMWTCEQSLPQQCLPTPWASSSVSPFNPHQLLSCFASWCVCVCVHTILCSPGASLAPQL